MACAGDPSPWVQRALPLLPARATCLDLACGAGRHARLLLDTGHRVCLVDRDLSAVADLATHPGAELIEADLEDGSPWPLPARRFDAVIVTRYLWRPLFPAILAALAPGGLLIYETFAQGHEKFGRPRNPDFLLRPGELREVCHDLEELAFEEAQIEADPHPQVVQRILARRNF